MTRGDGPGRERAARITNRREVSSSNLLGALKNLAGTRAQEFPIN